MTNKEIPVGGYKVGARGAIIAAFNFKLIEEKVLEESKEVLKELTLDKYAIGHSRPTLRIGIGMRFRTDTDEHILVSAGNCKVILVSLKTGLRWTEEAVDVESCTNLTEAEVNSAFARRLVDFSLVLGESKW